jgi:G:T-mismatch repair DNA endonuclease (very short patch repair protein)
VTPSTLGQGAANQNLAVVGTGFVDGVTAQFSGSDVTVNSVTFNSATSLTVNVSIAADAATTARDLTLTNPDNGFVTTTEAFTVSAAPTFTSITPENLGQGAANQNLAVVGTGFVDGVTAQFSGAGVTVNSVTFNSATSLIVNVSVAADAATTARNLTLTNPDNGFVTSSEVFTVTAAPTFTSITPDSRGQGAASQNLAVVGTGFVDGVTVQFSGAGVTVNSVTFNSATSLTVNVSVAADAAATARDLVLTNPDAGVLTEPGVFTVSAAPTFTSLTPNNRPVGSPNQNLAVVGSGFVEGITADFTGLGITVNSVTFNDATSLTLNVTIAGDAEKSARSLTLTNPDAGFITVTDVFTITDVPPTALAYSSPTSLYTINQGITNNIAQVTGGVENLSFTVHAGALPNGLNLNPNTGRIWGEATETGVFEVGIRVSNSGGFADASLTMTVANPTPIVSYNQGELNAPLNESIVPIAAVNTGGVVVTWSISPNLTSLTGLTFNTTSGRISGKPTKVSAPTEYTVTAIGYGDTQGQTTITISTTTSAPTVSYTEDPQSYPLGEAIVPLSKLGTTGIVTHYSISPALPQGLTFNTTTGRISGTPVTVVAAADYTVTVHGPGGTSDAVVSIAVTAVAPTVSYTEDPQSYPLGEAIAPLSKLGTSGIITHYSVAPALPSGLNFSTISGTITGLPTNLREATDYTVTAHGPGGTGEATINLTVFAVAPTVSYTEDPQSYPLGEAIVPLSKLGTTGIVTHYSISPALPQGLTFNTTTGRISGTPLVVVAAADYTVSVHGPGGTSDAVVNIAVTAVAPTVSYTEEPLSYLLNVPMEPLSKLGTTGLVTHYSISPALPQGMVFNTTTGRITGTPTVVTAATDYTITIHGPGGTGNAIVNIATTTPAPTVSYTEEPQSFPVGIPIGTLSKLGVTGLITHYSISPALPAGLTFNTTSGRISGTPTAAVAMTEYTVTVHGPGGTGNAVVEIATTVNAPVIAFENADLSFVLGAEIETFRAVNTGGPIVSWSISLGSGGGSLGGNTGLQFNPTNGRILGTPVYLSVARTYIVTAHGLAGSQHTAEITIATTPLAKVAADFGSSPIRVTGHAREYVFRLPELGAATPNVSVVITDMRGRQVWMLRNIQGSMARDRAVVWDGRDQSGRVVPAGIYVVRYVLQTTNGTFITRQRAPVGQGTRP